MTLDHRTLEHLRRAQFNIQAARDACRRQERIFTERLAEIDAVLLELEPKPPITKRRDLAKKAKALAS